MSGALLDVSIGGTNSKSRDCVRALLEASIGGTNSKIRDCVWALLDASIGDTNSKSRDSVGALLDASIGDTNYVAPLYWRSALIKCRLSSSLAGETQLIVTCLRSKGRRNKREIPSRVHQSSTIARLASRKLHKELGYEHQR